MSSPTNLNHNDHCPDDENATVTFRVCFDTSSVTHLEADVATDTTPTSTQSSTDSDVSTDTPFSDDDLEARITSAVSNVLQKVFLPTDLWLSEVEHHCHSPGHKALAGSARFDKDELVYQYIPKEDVSVRRLKSPSAPTPYTIRTAQEHRYLHAHCIPRDLARSILAADPETNLREGDIPRKMWRTWLKVVAARMTA